MQNKTMLTADMFEMFLNDSDRAVSKDSNINGNTAWYSYSLSFFKMLHKADQANDENWFDFAAIMLLTTFRLLSEHGPYTELYASALRSSSEEEWVKICKEVVNSEKLKRFLK